MSDRRECNLIRTLAWLLFGFFEVFSLFTTKRNVPLGLKSLSKLVFLWALHFCTETNARQVGKTKLTRHICTQYLNFIFIVSVELSWNWWNKKVTYQIKVPLPRKTKLNSRKSDRCRTWLPETPVHYKDRCTGIPWFAIERKSVMHFSTMDCELFWRPVWTWASRDLTHDEPKHQRAETRHTAYTLSERVCNFQPRDAPHNHGRKIPTRNCGIVLSFRLTSSAYGTAGAWLDSTKIKLW